jgi:hypothetical protein
MAASPVPASAHVDGSGTGVKFRKMSVAFAVIVNAPPPRLFWKFEESMTKSEALNPETEDAARRVHW